MHTYMQIITQEKCDSCQVGIILVDYFSLSNFMIYIAEFPRHKDKLIMHE
jgi:Ni,Fe-hydrogenase III small subunit